MTDAGDAAAPAGAHDAPAPTPLGDEPVIVLVNGLPGSGKTTVSRELARRFPRCVVLEGDYLQHTMTVTGLVGPGEEPADEAQRQLDLRWTNLVALARNFHAAGFTVIIDSLATPELAGDATTGLAHARLAHVMLAPDRAVGLQRDASRAGKTIGDRFDWVAEELERMRGLGVWLDTTHQSVAETVDAAEVAVRSGEASRWHRFTGRVLPVDSQDRVLLIEGFAPSRGDEPFWFTIGGAAEAGETLRQAAARELVEECAIALDDSALGEPFLVEQVVFNHSGFELVQEQEFYAVRLPDAPEPDLSGMEPNERATTLRAAWLPVGSLATGEGPANPRISTPRLAGICAQAVASLR